MKTAVKYDIGMIKEEAHKRVLEGSVSRNQPIYALCRYIPGRDWACVELELEENEFLLTDKIIDLLGNEEWPED